LRFFKEQYISDAVDGLSTSNPLLFQCLAHRSVSAPSPAARRAPNHQQTHAGTGRQANF